LSTVSTREAIEGERVTSVPSLTQLYVEHAPFIFRALRRLGVRDADAEDVLQEVFVVAHRKLGEFEGRSTLRTWLYGVAVRVAANHRRLARTHREVSTDEPPEQMVPALQHEDLAQKQARALLDRILDRLDEDKRSVFVLYELEGCSMQDVALAVGCPLQTAYSRLHAARKLVEAGVRALRAREEES
jgi:RNA polymerase sigma-70 factor (ECF subfamily)